MKLELFKRLNKKGRKSRRNPIETRKTIIGIQPTFSVFWHSKRIQSVRNMQIYAALIEVQRVSSKKGKVR